MIDKEQIAIMVKDIDRYLNDLGKLGIDKKSDLKEPQKYYAASMLIFSIVNRVLDIANELIAGLDLPVPASYRDTFMILMEKKAISVKTAEKMNKLAKYRNVIAHEYYRLTEDEVFQLKKDVEHVSEFINEVKKKVG